MQNPEYYRELLTVPDAVKIGGVVGTLCGYDVAANYACVEIGDGVRVKCVLDSVDALDGWVPGDKETVAHWYDDSSMDRLGALVSIERSAGFHPTSGAYRHQRFHDLHRRTHTPGDVVAKIPPNWAECGYPLEYEWWKKNAVHVFIIDR